MLGCPCFTTTTTTKTTTADGSTLRGHINLRGEGRKSHTGRFLAHSLLLYVPRQGYVAPNVYQALFLLQRPTTAERALSFYPRDAVVFQRLVSSTTVEDAANSNFHIFGRLSTEILPKNTLVRYWQNRGAQKTIASLCDLNEKLLYGLLKSIAWVDETPPPLCRHPDRRRAKDRRSLL